MRDYNKYVVVTVGLGEDLPLYGLLKKKDMPFTVCMAAYCCWYSELGAERVVEEQQMTYIESMPPTRQEKYFRMIANSPILRFRL
jgi:hypothetical protein